MGIVAQIQAWSSGWRVPLSLGQRGERAAARHLRRLGYTIVAQSARQPLGEIDLIAVDGRKLVFVEVKTRRSHAAGTRIGGRGCGARQRDDCGRRDGQSSHTAIATCPESQGVSA